MKTRRTSTGRDRGAIAVETAIAVPLLALLFFGVLEMGNLLRTRTALTDATREGARVAAALPRENGYQNNALAAVQGVVNSNQGERIDYVVLYRADPLTGDPLSGQPIESCTNDCWRFEWLPGIGFEQKLGASWPADDHYACGGVADTDWLAVYARGHYAASMPFLNIDRVFTTRTIMRFEPMELGVPCRPTP